MSSYEQLRETLDAHPSTAPKGKAIDQILHILFTPEEADRKREGLKPL
jgi:uncharacterized ferredoxin-like protein